MRIIAGEFRSRKLLSPEGKHTRPTQDQVKEAVFSSLGGKFDGGFLLDPFAGSGAIGFEALSRGMDKVLLADNDYEAVSIIKKNAELLKVECEIWKCDYHKTLLQASKKGYQFDYIYVDPPYDFKNYEQFLDLLKEYNLLKKDAIIIIETLNETEINDNNYYCYKEAKYGVARIRYYRLKED